MYMTRTGIYRNVQTCMYVCLFVYTWYRHVHTMYVHVWYFLTCMYMLNTCLYSFSKSCPGGQDSRCETQTQVLTGANLVQTVCQHCVNIWEPPSNNTTTMTNNDKQWQQYQQYKITLKYCFNLLLSLFWYIVSYCWYCLYCSLYCYIILLVLFLLF